MFDYDELECPICGHVGLLPDGGFDAICPVCDSEIDFTNNREDDELNE